MSVLNDKRYIKTLNCLLKWQVKNMTDLSPDFQLKCDFDNDKIWLPIFINIIGMYVTFQMQLVLHHLELRNSRYK